MASIFDKFAELNYPSKKDVVPTKTPKATKTIGDLSAIIETQRIYNSKIPPTNPSVAQETLTPTVKPAPKAQIEKGTTAVSDTEGTWGRPAIEGK